MPKHRITKMLSRPARIIITGWFFAGCSFMLGFFSPSINVNPAINQTQEIELALGFALMVGSSLALFSTLPWRNASTSWRLELLALPILIMAWLLYTVLVIVSTIGSLFPLAIGLSATIACSYRLYEVSTQIKRTRQNVEIMNGSLNA